MCYKIFNVCTKCKNEHFTRFNSCGKLKKKTPDSRHKPQKILNFVTGPCAVCLEEVAPSEALRNDPESSSERGRLELLEEGLL